MTTIYISVADNHRTTPMPNFEQHYGNDIQSLFVKEYGYDFFTQEQRVEILKEVSGHWTKCVNIIFIAFD